MSNRFSQTKHGATSLQSETELREQARASGVAGLPSAVSAARPVDARFSILRRRGAWRDALRRRLLAMADLIGVMLAAVVVDATNRWPGVVALSAATLPLWLVLAKLFGLYDNDHRALRHLTVDELPNLFAWATTGTAINVLVLSLVSGNDVAAGTAVEFWLCVAIATPPLRSGARAIWRQIVPAEHALLVGSGPLETMTRRKLDLFSDIHVRCVGVIRDEQIDGAEHLDPILATATREAPGLTLDRIIVASQTVSEPLIAELVKICRREGLKLSVVPPARAMFGTAVQLHHIADLPMIEYSTWDVPRSTVLLKRTMDIGIAAIALVVLSPILLSVAVAIKLSSRGPTLFVHRRAGRDGVPFRMFKFRTMVQDAQQRLNDLVDLAALEHPVFKLQSDPRVTAVGRFLRRTSIDELPQLLNVLAGSMSLVGPRPEQVELVERYAPEHSVRLAVRPGLTGPMQVYGRGDLSLQERLAVEREYVENLALRRDLRILMLTLAAVVRGRGAY